jgi:hypothetical protein
MTDSYLKTLTVVELVERFAEVTHGQYKAELRDENGKYNRLYHEMSTIEQELKSRAGDQRSALTVLYEHPNPQVRLMAAQATLAVAPAAARQVLQLISDRKEWPQAADANGTLWRLESGERKPS